MTDIFISYALADQDRASAIVQALKGAGYDVWWDRDIVAGVDRKVAIAEKLAEAKLCMILWSAASASDLAVMDEAEAARARGVYLGVLLDKVELPFGFGGYAPVEAAPFKAGSDTTPIVEAAKTFMASGLAAPEALEALPERVEKGRNPLVVGGIAAAVLAVVGLLVFFALRSGAPTPGQIVDAKLGGIPCAWLRVDPVRDGSDGTIGLLGVAGDPAKAGAVVRELVKTEKMAINDVDIEKVAQIDGRECPAIDEPIKLRKTAGGRLRVTGDPFYLDTSLAKPQALTRVEIDLDDKDKSMALFGVEPSGVVTWALPDLASLDALKGFDVGYTASEGGKYEFSIYPDHLGWTGLFVIVGDRELIKKLPQGTVQSSRDFAATLREATAQGEWDADMVWFKIEPKP